jgi:hypothetical protein
MRTQTSTDVLTTRDKFEGWIFGAVLAIGLPALIFATTH